MSSLGDSELVVRRLRGLGLIPAGTGAVLSRQGRSRRAADGTVPQGSRVLWLALDSVTSRPLGIASRFGARYLLGCERWQLRKDGDTIWVEPEGTGRLSRHDRDREVDAAPVPALLAGEFSAGRLCRGLAYPGIP